MAETVDALQSLKLPGGRKVYISIDSGVPIPQAATQPHGSKYPFAQMRINDSFFLPAENGDLERIRTALGSSARLWADGQTPKVWFALRTVTEGGRLGVRIWRVGSKRGGGRRPAVRK